MCKDNEIDPFLVLACLILIKVTNLSYGPHSQSRAELGTQIWPVVLRVADFDIVDATTLYESTDIVVNLMRTSVGMASSHGILGGGTGPVTESQLVATQAIRMVSKQLLLLTY